MSNWKIIGDRLITRWANKVDPNNPLPAHPKPQLKRDEWFNLNGLWDYAIVPKNHSDVSEFDGKILVPFPVESPISGVKKTLRPKDRLWYRRYFSIPSSWSGRKVLLHFGAVDFRATVYLNNIKLGIHEGGYTPFTFEISQYLQDINELKISVWDPTGKGCQERGKQLLRNFLIYYTAVSGIWQTVWLEPVNNIYIENLKLKTDIENEILEVHIKIAGNISNIRSRIIIKDPNNKIINSNIFHIEDKIQLDVPDTILWSPENPYLYNLEIELLKDDIIVDKIESYFGMREISIKKDSNEITRIYLNNKSIFQYGVLDQGYWPDGLYTAPTEDALKYDIEIAKELGFNMIRKHVKIEPALWYYHCDKLGMLVWQDMPNGGRYLFIIGKKRNKKCKKIYYKTLKSMINLLYNSPSIVVWVPFNEGWGQFETAQVTDFIRNYDSNRLIDSASGWKDRKVGDIKDIHAYPGPKIPKLEDKRVAVLGEFGGLGLKIDDHVWKNKKFKWSYKKSKDSKTMETKYTNLVSDLKPLKKIGLSAAVYTQITDVEGEINGLITYDREVIKIDKEKIRKLHLDLIKTKTE
ncbi:MAG: beta-galactosidase [Candidatus Lokiarchaeota archaeon]|nr:beta-galactosidase [Candidatus Lokiarchaeota archaeon]